MKFKKLVKADENFDEEKFELVDNATHTFYDKIEGVATYFKKLGLSQKEIMEALLEAENRLEDVHDEI